MRRVNNGSSGFVTAGIALGVGVVASIAASFLIDSALSTQSPTVQEGALVALAAAAAYWIPNPAIVGGVVTGLLLIPAAKLLYAAMPSLVSQNAGNPEGLGSAGSSSAVTTTPTTAAVTSAIGTLHRAGLIDGRMGTLHRSGGFAYGGEVGGGDMDGLHPVQRADGSQHYGTFGRTSRG